MTHRGKVWWTELNTWDPEGAKAFYQRALGWTFESGPVTPEGLPPYWLAKRDGEVVCGIFTLRSPDFDGIPSHWLTYLATDDIDSDLNAALEAGGKLYRDKICIAGVGTFVIVADSSGAAFGLIQPEAGE